jgi:hypothetical protein
MEQRRKVNKTLLACLVFLAALVLGSPLFASEPPEIGVAEVKALMDKGKALVIFPLTSIEFNNMHIAGSVNIELENIPAGLPANKDQTLIFYCLGPS